MEKDAKKRRFLGKTYIKKSYLIILKEHLCWGAMQNTTLHLPELYLKLIDKKVEAKEYPCTSEFIRIAIRKLLKRDYKLISNPIMGEASTNIQELVNKRYKPDIQKSLDQFNLILKMNPAVQQELAKQQKNSLRKQTRIDRFWK